MLMVLVGVPRTESTLVEAVLQARLRGMEVVVADTEGALARLPRRIDVATVILADPPDAAMAARSLAPLGPAFVVSFTEFHLVLAAAIRERLGLPGNSVEVEERVRIKDRTRLRLHERGLTSVRFAVATLDNLDQTVRGFEPPFVVKPVDLTGSIGVHAVESLAEMNAFRDRFVDFAVEQRRGRRFLVETFVPGNEYSVEGICFEGSFHLLAVTLKYTDGVPNFAEIGHLLPADERIDAGACARYLQQVVTALEIGTAPIHAEVKIDGNAIDLIEIHTRFAGDSIPELFERAFGRNLFALYYDALIHGMPPIAPPARCVSGIQFFHADDLTRLTALARQWSEIRYLLSIEARNGHVTPSLDNVRILNHRVGQLIFDAPTPDAAERFVADLRGTTDAHC